MNPPEGTWIPKWNEETLFDVWKKICQFDSVFMDDDLKNSAVFLNKLLPPTVTLMTDGGMMWLQNIRPGLRGEVHFTFWDKKLSSRLELIQNCLIWGFLSFDLQRIETYVANYAYSIQRFIEKKLNFKKEGTLRNRVFHRNELIDVHVYSILKEEVL